MKKALFIFFVILLSGVTVAGTLKTYKSNIAEANKEEMKKFVEVEPGVYSYDPKNKEFSLKEAKAKYSYYKFSPIDGAYFSSPNSKKPISLKKSGNKTIISITEGQYVFELNDIFEKYEIHSEDFNINQLGKGVFYVNNIKGDYRIYSFNSLLRIDLLSKPNSRVTFDLFPSLLFKYNPEYNKNLLSIEYDPKTKKNIEKSADVLRISQIDPIIYVDSKDKKFYSQILSNATSDNLIKTAVSDIKSKFNKYGQLYDVLVEMNIEDIPGTNLSKEYSPLFQNQTKKIIYLKNTVAKNFIELLKNSGDKAKIAEVDVNVMNIETALAEMQGLSDDFYKEGVDIIKNYYYISYFGNIFNKVQNQEYAQGGVGAGMKKIFKEKIAGDDYFGELSDLFFTYQFTDIKKDVLDSNVDAYLGGLLEKKVLNDQDDFLNFSFFLTQYSLSQDEMTKSSINIVKYLIDMFQSYYLTIRNPDDKGKEEEKKFSTLSVQFYSLTKIIKKINNSIISNYFEKNKDGTVQLKSEYVQDSGDYLGVNISQEILSGLVALYRMGTKDMQNKKNDFMKLLDRQRLESNGTKNNYSLLEEQYAKLKYINDEVLGNYNAWIKKQNLKKEFRDAKELIYEETVEMSKEDALSYLSRFNGVDVGSFILANGNTLKKDLFYQVSINVNSSNLSFKLYPEGHKMSNIVIEDINTKNKKNYPTSIILDDKEELYRDILASADTPEKRQKADFRNFLINMLTLGTDEIPVNNVTDNPEIKPTEARYISLFKQNKLIDGDFTFIKKFISIPFAGIDVKIVDEEYVINIKDADKVFEGKSGGIPVKLSSSYNFANKTFENISLLVMKEDSTAEDPFELGGEVVEIVPIKIGLKEFSSKLSGLGKYLDTIKENYVNGSTNIKVDLNSGKVYINSKSFIINE